MMETLLELDQICLIPADTPNGGMLDATKVSFNVINSEDNSVSLPIFTAPLPSVISGNNYNTFYEKGIRPILPRTEDINYRLDGCQYIFAAFTLREIQQHFLSSKRVSNKLFRLCIETGNGHDMEILNVSVALKRLYGNQVCIMAGNIGNPKIYIDYCKAGIDYVRVGLGSSSLVNREVYGFYYPLASLLIDIIGVKNTACTGLRHAKIVADGGIAGPVDIVKAMALGADYVMMGKGLAKVAEAAGPGVIKTKDGQREEINKTALCGMSKLELREKRVQRIYAPISLYDNEEKRDPYDMAHLIKKSSDVAESWINVTTNLSMWLLDMYDVFQYAFLQGKAMNWTEYKSHIKFGKVINNSF